MFYGWWIVGACLWILAIGIGGASYTFGVFFNPLVTDFGWSRAELSLANSMSVIMPGLMAPLAGQWTNRFGARRVVAVGGLLSGAALALLSVTQSLPQFYAFYFIFSLGLSGMALVPLNTVISKWFQRRRGLALGVIATGLGLGGVLLVPVTGFLIAALGWRGAYTVLGLTLLGTVLPLSLLVIRERPQEMGLLPDGKQVSQQDPPGEGANRPTVAMGPPSLPGMSFGQALHGPAFWLIALAYALYSLGLMSMLAHTIPYFTDRGLSPSTAAAIVSTMAAMGMVGKIVGGFLADRFSPKLLAVVCLILQIAAFAIIVTAQSELVGFVFAILFGFSFGGLVPLQSMLLLRYFGLSDFATIFGLFTLFFNGGGALGPVIAGYVFDTTGTYLPILTAYLVFNVAAVGLLLLLRQPQPKVV